MMTYGNEEVENIWTNHFNGIWQSSHGPVQDQILVKQSYQRSRLAKSHSNKDCGGVSFSCQACSLFLLYERDQSASRLSRG